MTRFYWFPSISPQNHFTPWGDVPNCMGRCGGACEAVWSTVFTALGGVNCRELLEAMWPMFTTHGPHSILYIDDESKAKLGRILRNTAD